MRSFPPSWHPSHTYGPGSFQVALLDALWNVTADQVAASDIIETN